MNRYSAPVWLLVMCAAGCEQRLPMQPSAPGATSPAVMAFEGEAGIGDGPVFERSRASGGRTVHLAPGERRQWTFRLGADETRYQLLVTYSNSHDGDNEILTVTVDGAPASTFRTRDSGEGADGWNLFVTDPAGSATLRAGSHTLVIESNGGDGCVEIDVLTIRSSES
jgi:hypothetical protein